MSFMIEIAKDFQEGLQSGGIYFILAVICILFMEIAFAIVMRNILKDSGKA